MTASEDFQFLAVGVDLQSAMPNRFIEQTKTGALAFADHVKR
jgi:hypothetical protein